MKFCTKCGNQLLDESVICPKCGCSTETEIKTPTPQLKTISPKPFPLFLLFVIIGLASSFFALLQSLIYFDSYAAYSVFDFLAYGSELGACTFIGLFAGIKEIKRDENKNLGILTIILVCASILLRIIAYFVNY